MASSKLKDTWWPDIHDTDTARRVARQAFWAAIVVVVLTVVLAGLAAFGTSVAGITPAAFVDAAMFGLVAVGIWRMSRIAAVAGLVLFGIEKLLMVQTMKPGNLIVAVALLFAFANGVRATVAYHKLQSAAAQPAAGPPLAPR